MDVSVTLNTVLNKQFSTFSLDMIPDLGKVPFRTGNLVKDAFMHYCECTYGVKIKKIRDKWSSNEETDAWCTYLTDDPRCTWLLLQSS